MLSVAFSKARFAPALFVVGGAVAACTVGVEPKAEVTGIAALRQSDCAVGPDGLFDELRCTGLYSDWESRTIDPALETFAPGFELWSDGAKKTRWIHLPPGTTIDASDMNNWVFPVGTKIWKEFRLPLGEGGSLRHVETRLLHKIADRRWVFATYVWSPDQDSAKRVTTGMMPFPGTESYEVPAERTCRRCHGNKPDFVLGFESVLLSAPEATGLAYDRLVAEGRLSTQRAEPLPTSTSLQIPGTPVERDAIGRLHANCGISCHNPTGPAPFSMRIDSVDGMAPGSVAKTSVFAEAIGERSFFSPSSGLGTYYRIRPTDEEGSTVFYRMSRRDGEQMPPIATHQIDPNFVESLRSWIRSMTAAPYPPPGPR